MKHTSSVALWQPELNIALGPPKEEHQAPIHMKILGQYCYSVQAMTQHRLNSSLNSNIQGRSPNVVYHKKLFL